MFRGIFYLIFAARALQQQKILTALFATLVAGSEPPGRYLQLRQKKRWLSYGKIWTNHTADETKHLQRNDQTAKALTCEIECLVH